jgi:hypothetical protein
MGFGYNTAVKLDTNLIIAPLSRTTEFNAVLHRVFLNRTGKPLWQYHYGTCARSSRCAGRSVFVWPPPSTRISLSFYPGHHRLFEIRVLHRDVSPGTIYLWDSDANLCAPSVGEEGFIADLELAPVPRPQTKLIPVPAPVAVILAHIYSTIRREQLNSLLKKFSIVTSKGSRLHTTSTTTWNRFCLLPSIPYIGASPHSILRMKSFGMNIWTRLLSDARGDCSWMILFRTLRAWSPIRPCGIFFVLCRLIQLQSLPEGNDVRDNWGSAWPQPPPMQLRKFIDTM